MRIFPFIISALITGLLIFFLNNKWGAIPPLGKFLSPQQGFWQNADPTDEDFNASLHFKNLKGKVSVYLDERLVPHVFADNDEDVYFVQGYLHAKFRLWQMEFQCRAAAGRLTEVLGYDPKLVNYDRLQRRIGMVYGAENELKEVAKDPVTQKVYDAYTAGVNEYIHSLSQNDLPIEYKLLDYKPEEWTNLKVALFFKNMSSELAGQSYARDIEFTNEKSFFSKKEIDILYPQISDSSMPIIPKGTPFEKPAVSPVPPSNLDSFYLQNDTVVKPVPVPKPIDIKGSNNWAVSGAKTKSGAPILCNDPHLRLTLPSIWFEMQLHTPTMNVYGVSFPSVPGVVIGFNDSIAFGLTNAGRDVIDYYQIRFKDASKKEYWYNNKWEPTTLRIEQFKIRGASVLNDTVAYTAFGPVTYDRDFTTGDSTSNMALAMRWTAHDPSNEMKALYQLNRAKNYTEYVEAIKDFTCPGQNMLFASKSGDIAIWQQGKFPARWKDQGMYIMPGENADYAWQGYIPQNENPHILNPPNNFLQSANQRAVDSTYPYFIPGDYITPRSVSVYNHLAAMQNITPQDMMALQSNNESTVAQDAVPLFLKYLHDSTLNDTEKTNLKLVKSWNYSYEASSKGATFFQLWLDSLKAGIWNDEMAQVTKPVEMPSEQTLIEILLRDSSFRFVDNINTPEKETLPEQITEAFKKASATYSNVGDAQLWWKHRNTSILHLLRESLMPFARTGLEAGGWSSTINALTKTNGPSWRMIVHLTNPTEAYGVYPGGQSGNPGSKFYDSFIDTWKAGKYYTLWMMEENETNDPRIKWKMTFTNS